MLSIMKVKNTVIPLDTPIDVLQGYCKLSTQFKRDELFLLESLAGPRNDCRKSIIGFNPLFTLKISKNEQRPILELLREFEARFDIDYDACNIDLSYRFGAFGYLTYDAVRHFETLPKIIADNQSLPSVLLTIYQGVIYTDLASNHSYLILNQFADIQDKKLYSEAEILALLNIAENNDITILDRPIPAPMNVRDTITQEEFFTWTDTAFEHICQGDIYQIQLGHEIQIQSHIDPFLVYQRMRVLNPSPYMYFTELDGITIIGASPELCVNVKDKTITIRPIAGTIKRGSTPAEDQTQQDKLLTDPKERAEHLMLIDLARNDISRICQTGSLQVTEYMVIERYSHVFHIVSNVIGHLAPAADHYDVIAASFPAGTLTGTPKIRAMELIESTEKTRRGLYGGAIGLIDFRGNIEMAICIRTALYQNSTYSIRASAGIVIDSKKEAEWNETISKMSAPYLAITGKELKNENLAH